MLLKKDKAQYLLLGFVVLLFCFSSTQAAIYRYKSNDGTIAFSDEPHQGATQVILPPVSQYSSAKPIKKTSPQISAEKDKAVAMKTQKTGIILTSLKDNDTVRNNNTVPLQVNAKVETKLQKNEQAQLLVDDKVMAVSQDVGPIISFTLMGVNRGMHRLKAVVVNQKANKNVSSSPAIKVYFQQNAVRLLLSSKSSETKDVSSDGAAANVS